MKRYLNRVDIFCLDLNGIIHQEAAKVFGYGDKSKDMSGLFKKIDETYAMSAQDYYTLESLLFKNIILAVLRLSKIVKPQQTIYVAVDGVAPQAKINQQRGRRYKSSLAKTATQIFDSTCITPGTEFMFRLDAYLNITFNAIINKTIQDPDVIPFIQNIPSIIYSSHMVRGEGEHKIADYIRNLPQSNKNIVVHGMDADLIMIYMLIMTDHPVGNISLFRENNEDYSIKTIIDLKTLSKALSQLYTQTDNNVAIIREVVFLLYLFGNDFVPRFPELELSHQALDALIFGYQKYKQGGGLAIIDQIGVISWLGLANFLMFFTEQYANQLLSNWAFSSVIPQPCGLIQFSSLNGKLDDTKFRELWFDYTLGPKSYDYLVSTPEEDKQQMCIQYCAALAWVYQYYRKGLSAINVRWFYPYHYTPDLRYLAEFLTGFYEENLVWEDESINTMGSYPTVLEQLSEVIPPSSTAVLPSFLRPLLTNPESPLADMYPTTFLLDGSGKAKPEHEQIALLPIPEPDRVAKVLTGITVPEHYQDKWKEDKPKVYANYLNPKYDKIIEKRRSSF